ncbi:hypothetical protein [Macrococcoides canis]|uniref:hypothetical protein n=1 Tax=Macrococcoides canis TaxID=1855823 RepID=UPI001060805F|nr:hypothetical protein [Macrococcus canis]TDM22438.1 hypothetical protein ETI02_08615 [Macrococcus canis]TDM30231.1 hypothetical protein ETI03_08875 [Macrococcus canis]
MHKFKMKTVATLLCIFGLTSYHTAVTEAAEQIVTTEQPSTEQVESLSPESSVISNEDKSSESPVIEIVSTEIITETETAEPQPTTERPTTEAPSEEKTPTTEMPSVEVDQPSERPTVEYPVTEQPTTEHPTIQEPIEQPSHEGITDSVSPHEQGNGDDHSGGGMPGTSEVPSNGEPPSSKKPSTGTIDLPELPETPMSPAEPSEPEQPSLEEDDEFVGIKPGKFKPTDGEAYYAALDKQVCDLVTREIGKSKKTSHEKDAKTSSKPKQKVKKHAILPDTGESIFMYVLIPMILLLSGILLLRRP